MTNPTTDDQHLATWQDEQRVSVTERNWLRWIDQVEALLGHSADGDQAIDNYSMDGFYRLFEKGCTPAEAISRVGAVAL